MPFYRRYRNHDQSDYARGQSLGDLRDFLKNYFENIKQVLKLIKILFLSWKIWSLYVRRRVGDLVDFLRDFKEFREAKYAEPQEKAFKIKKTSRHSTAIFSNNKLGLIRILLIIWMTSSIKRLKKLKQEKSSLSKTHSISSSKSQIVETEVWN